MFTGLVQAVGVVREVSESPAGARLVIDPRGWAHRPASGDSISVSGCCLTVTKAEVSGWVFDVVQETLRKTKLGKLRVGGRVNLEHAVTPTTLLGGHFVQGHVDGVGTVQRVWTGGEVRMRVGVPAELAAYLTPKGSIAVDGVSLTIAGTARAGEAPFLEVALIPTTLQQTTLGELREGDPVNIETDVIAKTVVTWLENSQAAQRTDSQ